MRNDWSPHPDVHASWVDRPTGGAMKLRGFPGSTDAQGVEVELEFVWAHGRPWWFWHVLQVPLEIEAALA